MGSGFSGYAFTGRRKTVEFRISSVQTFIRPFTHSAVLHQCIRNSKMIWRSVMPCAKSY